VVTNLRRSFRGSLILLGFWSANGYRSRIPPSPPPDRDVQKTQNRAFLEPPDSDGGEPRWRTLWDPPPGQAAIIQHLAEAESLRASWLESRFFLAPNPWIGAVRAHHDFSCWDAAGLWVQTAFSTLQRRHCFAPRHERSRDTSPLSVHRPVPAAIRDAQGAASWQRVELL
jgi:hypothetical protein